MCARRKQSDKENAGQDLMVKMFHLVLYVRLPPNHSNRILKPDNADDWKAPIVGGNNTSMAENYYLLFKPLPVGGNHTIRIRSHTTTASSESTSRARCCKVEYQGITLKENIKCIPVHRN